MLLCTRGLLKGNVFITNKLEIPHLMQIVSFDANNFKVLGSPTKFLNFLAMNKY